MDADRDLDKQPYSPDEMRVVKWIVQRTGVSGGSDPIGFLIASHEYIAWEREQYRQALVDHGIEVDERADPINANDILAELSPEKRAAVLERGRQLIAEERVALKNFDVAEYLDSPEAIAAYLQRGLRNR
jgi:hypothetical protein